MKETTTREEIFQNLEKELKNLDSDGQAIFFGNRWCFIYVWWIYMTSGANKKDLKNSGVSVISIHCLVQIPNRWANSVNMNNVMQVVVHIVNSLRAKGL